MAIKISIQRESAIKEIPSNEDIKFFIRATLINFPNTEITVRIVDEAESQKLNAQFRQKNKPTNVLAFPYDDTNYLGDLVLCAPVLTREAKQQGKSMMAHWAHLLVHGMLHLQGYDHINDVERQQMEALEIKILKQLNFPNPYEEDLLYE